MASSHVGTCCVIWASIVVESLGAKYEHVIRTSVMVESVGVRYQHVISTVVIKQFITHFRKKQQVVTQ